MTIALETRLGGHPPTAGVLRAREQSRGLRAGRAAGALLLFAAIGAVAAFIPPHVPWAVAALLAGFFFGFRQWRSEYRVESLTTTCPRCGSALSVKSGEGVRLPLKLTCFQCHHEPVLTTAG